ncbi:MAG TPA: 50S ribosomal protein L30 [Terriglobales bacterium]|nr:50S ribosomal protein L30 [Terriglobales bacterium]
MATKTAAPKKSAATLRLQWTRSAIAAPEKHKKVIRGLGFTRLNQTIEREDSPAVRGMVAKVPHLVQIVE